MSNRYERLFYLNENQYIKDSPVILLAGALLKDRHSGQILAQLKIKNIGNKVIKSVKVQIYPMDTAGRNLGDSIEYQYLDLSVERDVDFGSKTAISLPDNTTRSFKPSIIEVVFKDNTIWSNEEQAALESLPTPGLLLENWDNELVKQYQIKFGQQHDYLFQHSKGLWLCSCGAINYSAEICCHCCGTQYSDLLNLDLSALEKEKESRLAEEQRQQKIRQAELELRQEEQKKTHKKHVKAFIVVSIILSVIITVSLIWKFVITPYTIYNGALSLMTDQKYTAAIQEFEKISDYKDSIQKINECQIKILDKKYENAVSTMEAKNFEDAIEQFRVLNNYKGCDKKIEECELAIKERDYEIALEFLESGNIVKTRKILNTLKGYKDSDFIMAKLNFDGKWRWISPAMVNPWDSFIFDIEEQTITYIFQSPVRSDQTVYSFEIIDSTTLHAESLRHDGPLTIRYTGGKLALEYDDDEDKVCSQDDCLFLIR